MAQTRERVPVVIVEYDQIARTIAERIAALIRERNAAGRPAVLGLATGSTPIGIYRELIRLHRDGGLSFANVMTFNLDEYYPMAPDSIHSYVRYMWENLFDHIDIPRENVHIPAGDVPRDEVEAFCAGYERAIHEAGGIDFQILGIGKTGHIGFNEPGSGVESRTRLIALDTVTRRDAAADFFGEDNVPTEAITMGVASILEAKEIALVATGEHKAAIVRRSVEGEPDPDVAATYLQEHPSATFYLDPAAAADLTRIRTPWVVGEVRWDRQKEIEALIWLSQVTKKSLLKLDADDYREHHLSSLLARYGSAGPLNGEVFNALLSKVRGRSRLPQDCRIIVFSPHPDDDVISMGGILNKLHQNGNRITVAYQTSGNIAVFDHEVRRYVDWLQRFARDFSVGDGRVDEISRRIERFLAEKKPGEVDIPEVQTIKRRIREAEAVSGIETFGMARDQACFLDLPFYQTGKVRKDPIGPADVAKTLELLEQVRPELIFVAGDLSDPHGTHRMCLEAVHRALEGYSGEAPEIWYYRGAWQEWPVSEADVLVPLSEEELRLKILAIYKHQSQKDRAPFPGQDEREFWQRVEERNTATARVVDRLGLPEYFAMEAYVVRRQGKPLDRPTLSTADVAEAPRRRRATDHPAWGTGRVRVVQGAADTVGELGGADGLTDGTIVAGVDGGGTKTTLALADAGGRELARRVGPAGLVDPRDPAATARMLAGLVRGALDDAGLEVKPVALVAGLAGVGNERERSQVETALAAADVADRVSVVTDGAIALDGALGGKAGILIIAGTGSVAYGRGEDGRVQRCGGWGMVVGDEGSAWSIGRNGLAAALRAADGRGPPTRLLHRFVELLGLEDERGIPSWTGRAEKAGVAALAVHVVSAAEEGDAVALQLLEREARELACHAVALARRLEPWSGAVPVAFHGGVLGVDFYADVVRSALDEYEYRFEVRPSVADAVAGALSYARRMAEEPAAA